MPFVWSETYSPLLQQITRAPCVCHSPFRTIMATPLSNLGGASQILTTRPTLRRDSKPQSRWLTVTMSASKKRECHPVQVSRRASVTIAMAALLQQLGIGSSQAEEGNGLWLTGPLPVPTVTNGKQAFRTTRVFLTV
ncbi:hypothetical protein BHE74_00025086 [Ensete ventricosum]|nr:hypothetical protein BHE74_00025086 [Ensete ventricosum]